jgi:3-hydroxymyristoyl/3-hydroxydecanoyl-(acyl carrier protein) dehydratase
MPEIRLPTVLTQAVNNNDTDNKSAEYLLEVPADLAWFEGHFPKTPILPGVVQIDWVMHFIKDLELLGEFSGVDRMKFMRLIQPDTQLKLSLRAAADCSSVTYRFFDDNGSYSSGNIQLKR